MVAELELAAMVDGRRSAQLVVVSGFSQAVAEGEPGLPLTLYRIGFNMCTGSGISFGSRSGDEHVPALSASNLCMA